MSRKGTQAARQAAAERSRRRRAREAAGLVIVSVEVDPVHLAAVLEAAGYLPAWSEPAAGALGEALGRMVGDLRTVDVVTRDGARPRISL